MLLQGPNRAWNALLLLRVLLIAVATVTATGSYVLRLSVCCWQLVACVLQLCLCGRSSMRQLMQPV